MIFAIFLQLYNFREINISDPIHKNLISGKTFLTIFAIFPQPYNFCEKSYRNVIYHFGICIKNCI
jgi:hypothetical protein